MKAKVMMLETADKSMIFLYDDKDSISTMPLPVNSPNTIHIYLIDPNAEIKEGDWYIDDIGQIRKSVTSGIEYLETRKDYDKIICSTDKSLKLPLLSEQSIKILID